MASKSSLYAEVSSTVKSSESLDYEAEEEEEDSEVLRINYKELPEDYFDSLIEVDEWRDDGSSKMPAAAKENPAAAGSKNSSNVVKTVKTKEPAASRETRAKERSKSPPKRKAKSPEKSSRTSPKRKKSKSPNERKSKSPLRRSKSPQRRRSRSPARRRSPPKRRSPIRRPDRRVSPLRRPLPRKRSVSPMRRVTRAFSPKRRSISPRKRSTSPGRRRSRSRSPAKKRSRSPDLFSARMSSRRNRQYRSGSRDKETSLSPEGSSSRVKAPLRVGRGYVPPVSTKGRTRSPPSYTSNQEVRIFFFGNSLCFDLFFEVFCLKIVLSINTHSS